MDRVYRSRGTGAAAAGVAGAGAAAWARSGDGSSGNSRALRHDPRRAQRSSEEGMGRDEKRITTGTRNSQRLAAVRRCGGAVVATIRVLATPQHPSPNAAADPQAAPLAACSSFSITRSSEKLAAFWRGGYSTKVLRNSPTKVWAGTSMKTWSNIQSQ